MTQKL